MKKKKQLGFFHLFGYSMISNMHLLCVRHCLGNRDKTVNEIKFLLHCHHKEVLETCKLENNNQDNSRS